MPQFETGSLVPETVCPELPANFVDEMLDAPFFHELRSAPVLSEADSHMLESMLQDMEMPGNEANFSDAETDSLEDRDMQVPHPPMPLPPMSHEPLSQEQPGLSDAPQSDPVEAAVAKEKRVKYARDNEFKI